MNIFGTSNSVPFHPNKRIWGKVLFCVAALALIFFVGAWIKGLWPTSSPAQITVDFSSLDPKEVVNLYWSASVTGDGETLMKLVSKETPGSFYRECPVSGNDESASDKVEIHPPFEGAPGGISPKAEKPPSKLFGKIDYHSIPYTVYHFSHYLYVNQPQLAGYNLTKQDVYGNEALIEIAPLTNPQDYSTRLFFLNKESTGWKIFSIDSRMTLFIVGNKKFGQNRQCKYGFM
jgi:hypothetical protein